MAHKRGIDLRVERVRAGAKQRDVARYMGVSVARVSVLERSGLVPDESSARFIQAVADYVAEQETQQPQSMRVDIVLPGVGTIPQQYGAAKSQARKDVRKNPSVRTVEVVIGEETPAISVIGYLDGLLASGVSPVLLDSHGTIVHRRAG